MSQKRQVVTLILLGISLRIALFDKVGIWGDMGFYTYDARLILDGQVPFIDFIGRSPLFNYSFAYFSQNFEQKVVALRAFISIWWVASAIPIYSIARKINGHKSGLAAMAIILLSPFALVYGMWSNTQSLMAFFSISAVWVLINKESVQWQTVAGICLGLAWLSRRSVFTVIAAVAIWTALQSARERDMKQFFRNAVSMSFGFLGTLLSAYALMSLAANGTLEYTIPLFDTHTIQLFFSDGRGGFPLITEGPKPEVQNTIERGRVPILNDLCQLCGAWTARTFAKTLFVTVPVVGVLFIYLRDLTDNHFDQNNKEYLFGILCVITLYSTFKILMAGRLNRLGIVFSLVLYAWLAYRIRPVSRKLLYDRNLQLVLLSLIMLSVGYLYRNRVLHTYYFMDFMPFLAVVSGILYAELSNRMKGNLKTAVFVIAVVLAVITSTAAAHPLALVVLNNNEAGWFTVDNLQEYQQDVPERADGQPVFTGHPSYVSGSEARLLFDMPRIHYFANTFNDTSYGDRLYAKLIESLRTGKAKIAIAGPMTEAILELNKTAEKTFVDKYCRAKDGQELYNKTGATLYEYKPDCAEEYIPDVENMSDGS